MTEAAVIISVFILGVVAGRISRSDVLSQQPAEPTPPILVKRTRASFRDPGRTAVTTYDEYKTSKGLFAPVRPGRGSTADEREVER